MLKGERPGDVRGFVHRRIIGGVRGFVGSGFDLGGAAEGFLRPTTRTERAGGRNGGKAIAAAVKFSRPAAPAGFTLHQTTPAALRRMVSTLPLEEVARRTGSTVKQVQERFGGLAPATARLSMPSLPFSPVSDGCVFPFRRDPISGECKMFLGDRPGPDGVGGCPPGSPGGAPPGRAVTSPQMIDATRLRCPPGYVLGRDELCYFGLPRNSKWRKWRPGRKPKFTAGDLNAIRKASSLSDEAEDLFKMTNPAKKAVARNYRANWRKPLKK